MKINFLKKLDTISIGVKASIVYTISSLLSSGLAIITIPIFTRLMSAEQIGIVNLFTSWNSTLDVFVTLALTSGGFAVAMKEFQDDRDRYMSSVLILTTFMALLLIIVYIIFQKTIMNFIGLQNSLIVLMLVGFIFTPARDFFLARQRYEYKYKLAGVITISSSIIASLFSVLAVIIANKNNIENLGKIRIFSTYLVLYVVAAILWVAILIRGHGQVKLEYWKFSLALSIPLIGNSIASQILGISDRVMISKIAGNSFVGIYSILYSASSISLIVWQSINNSFIPFLFEGIGKENQRLKIKRVSLQIVAVYSVVAVSLTLIAPEIIRLLATKEYYDAIYIMPPIAAGIFLTSIHNIYANVILYYKKSMYIMIATILAAFTNVILNYFGIHKFGYIAAAYTTLIANIVLAITQGVVSRKIHFLFSKEKKSIYNDIALFILSLITVLVCLLCVPLYKYFILRYFIVLMICVFAFLFRNKIVMVLKRI